ncbi:PilZ domain-containing protein [Aurantiacibacter sediminis]|uniref:PilZ domain-containing protein n=1 Tax=Aurantiacibacter sediminis TaxID=2793064 RepID=A0ABS0N003_9SPHN|nr:PilZ domain-containing protein [Aurantiacibacter sediminis]MBH5321294.1 PilZ domain-containing protein [Aurantiacibacter sediminis]
MAEQLYRNADNLDMVEQPATSVEQRRAKRYTLLIRAAKLVTPSGEFLGVIRDASETGISMRIFHRMPDCGSIWLELQNGDRYGVELRWQDGDRAGFRFASPADIKRIIESPSRFAKRPVRLNLTAAAEVECLGHREYATIQDISQQGAKVACSSSFATDQRVKLSAAGLPGTCAKVRWRRDGTCGLVFEETLQFEELARIARDLQRRP